MMNATQITPTQMHLLKLFSFDKSESRALEIKDVLMRYFQGRLDAEADQHESVVVTIPVSDRNLLRDLSRKFGWACML